MKYTEEEIQILQESEHLKDKFLKGQRINTNSLEIKELGIILKKHYGLTLNPSCSDCVSDMFKNLYNKLGEEIGAEIKEALKEAPKAKKVSKEASEPEGIKALREAFKEKHGKEVSNRYKNDAEWIKSKL